MLVLSLNERDKLDDVISNRLLTCLGTISRCEDSYSILILSFGRVKTSSFNVRASSHLHGSLENPREGSETLSTVT
jgi:hypothetical protein